MRNRPSLKILLSSLVIAFLFCSFLYVRLFDKNVVIIELIMGSLGQNHYQPQTLDDEFSKKVFDLYIKRLDYNKKFLTQEDYKELLKYRTQIDENIKSQQHPLFYESIERFKRKIPELEKLYKEVLSKKMDFSIDEYYITDGEKTHFAQNMDELKKEWIKMIKYQVLVRLDEELTKQEEALKKKDTVFTPKPFDSLEADARRKTLKANDEWFKRLKKMSLKDRFIIYANSISNVYDPHTEYYAPRDKKRFDQSMSGQFEGIGARLTQKDGILKVTEIIVGSPSYKQGELKPGDEILKVAQGAGEPVDVTDMDMEDAIELIKGKKGTEVRLTVRKPDGTIKVIPIIRDVVEIEETFAKSALIKDKNHLVGYIYLPSFYTDFTRTGAHHCSEDIEKEIEKLKKQNIQYLILDLRDNGGGSLQEVVSMTGHFIPKGPVVQVKDKNNVVRTMEDYNSKVVWNGPLVVMVNHNSASASEILAAAIQDYKRGIIVGSTTFGKGTVQSFLDLDYFLIPQFDTIKPVGSIKVTQQKFYRINGGSTQLKGVTPDIIFPGMFEYIDYGERELDYPLPWDQIQKANYTEFNYIPYDKIKQQSLTRISKNKGFRMLEDWAKETKKNRDEAKVPLELKKFRDLQAKNREKTKKFNDIKAENSHIACIFLPEDEQRLKSDTARYNREKKWLKNLKEDLYLNESVEIVKQIPLP
ncbi:MAG: carboxy terminal-processing peptidase [Bacteroidia bacterium]|nr:carboxy terminal-processing peptidase [Bacteroidia bacterium]